MNAPFHRNIEGYPDIPEPTQLACLKPTGIPRSPGVYFVWRDERIIYVGRSINLCQRVTLYHEKIQQGDHVSWLEFCLPDLNFAECFYIGVARPYLNFSNTIKHQSFLRDRQRRTAAFGIFSTIFLEPKQL
jgi:hypothetical protein